MQNWESKIDRPVGNINRDNVAAARRSPYRSFTAFEVIGVKEDSRPFITKSTTNVDRFVDHHVAARMQQLHMTQATFAIYVEGKFVGTRNVTRLFAAVVDKKKAKADKLALINSYRAKSEKGN